MTPCKNDTCSRMSRSAYCCRRCQVSTRNVDHKVGLPDIRVGMDLERLVKMRAADLGITVTDLVLNLLEQEVNYEPEWLDFGGAA